MKKLISLLLTVCCLLLFLTSCTGSAEKLVVRAMEKTEALDAYCAQLVMDIEMKAGTQEIEMLTVMDLSVVDATTRNPELYAEAYMEIMGESVEYEMYVEDGWVYMLQNGDGYKMSTHDAFDDEDDVTETFDDFFQELPETVYKDIKIVKNDDGSKSVSLSIPNDVFEDAYSDLTDSVMDSVTEGVAFSDLTLKNAVLDITVKDGYISVFEITFDMSMRIEGTRVTVAVKEQLIMKDMGDDVQVEPMEGYENFPLITQ